MNTLFVRLEGPLQSWGTRARWQERDTSFEPTKSGVVGLIACALGWGSARDAEIRKLSEDLRFGVRVDRAGRLLTDYQTVEGGVRSADGKIKINATTKRPETVVSHKAYLCDASFLAALQGPPGVIEQASAALLAPVWPPYLGRRSCVASRPFHVGTGDFPSLEDALRSHDLPERSGLPRLIIECGPGEGVRRPDEIGSLVYRVYRPRYTRDVPAVPTSTEPAVNGEE